MMVIRCRRVVEPELTKSGFSLFFFLSFSAVLFVVSFNVKSTKNILIFPKEDLWVLLIKSLTYSSVYGSGCITPPVALEQISVVSEKKKRDDIFPSDGTHAVTMLEVVALQIVMHARVAFF